jgi:hypothetical protein
VILLALLERLERARLRGRAANLLVRVVGGELLGVAERLGAVIALRDSISSRFSASSRSSKA